VKTPARLVLAEDHELFSQGLKAMLGGDYEVVAIVRDGGEVVDAVRRHRPDALLLDLSLPNRTGMDLLSDLRGLDPPLPIVVVTMHVDRVLVDAAIRLGASAFVPKDASVDELRTAIEEVLSGRRYLSPRLPRYSYGSSEVERFGFSHLTPRQQDIVRMIGRGLTTEDIAVALGISTHTVAFHRKNIRRHLGLESDWEMLRYAILIGLSEEPPQN
jgi:DNA-binding NarL/FixJ family response regulator